MATQSVKVTIEIDKADEAALNRQLNTLRERLSGQEAKRFLGQKAQPYVHKRIAARFASEGDDVVGKWAPLSPATRRIRAKHAPLFGWAIKPAHPINVRSGELRSFVMDTYALTTSAHQSTLAVPRARPSRRLQSKLKAAQSGPFNSRYPERPVIGLGRRDQKELTELATIWFDKMVRSL